MSFTGLTYISKKGSTLRSLNGFYGFTIIIDVTSLKITDYRGKGLSNVKLEAVNPTSGIPFIGFTDSKGTVFMDLDAVTDIIITKDQIVKTIQYNGEVSPTYQIDLDFIQK